MNEKGLILHYNIQKTLVVEKKRQTNKVCLNNS